DTFAAPDFIPENKVRPPPHQAPTLIGCKFLKIDRESAVKPSNHPAFSALLRQQQRNEIMKNLFRFVNCFFSLTA
ncbi:hypothetical protein, partial [Paraburkholderia sp. JHI869]|uniref:hypothetical protein n=1 Tax=Paraburkholderia sp. JHI869 TaxID=3112959 RepID=UPI00316B4A5B